MSENKILSAGDIAAIIEELSHKIYQDIPSIDNFAIVGIHTRGVEIADRIRTKLEALSGKAIKHGTLDISFYRDDLATRGKLPVLRETLIEFNINNKNILLVDDVLYTGRTTKAALETLMAFGRPTTIKLCVLIDRGGRELPIQPDYCGYKVQTEHSDLVKVRLNGTDKVEDAVFIVTQ
ncbi:MAG TPA: bifunctional pyr operon transcriptional regulator/uracil phosphoribosyltransferase PyrR [Spirochaetota bacterium]|jgi:pyrimidine operon attenuation protein/uracil phosphoribosyltransferase|nr:bifunctional pyr operon transcriptional regulator/uracil phosphoribosyltransferase PyrR [Spirochaetota bacterium]OQA97120.1 MAG: Bifunctional protein PyrR [Spirochaetes bacterium ADurb.Bin218]HOK01880.1 bifunctional pyr operon transcriptional regulator/uracil phosphoribosyltransferase PyrR [Spirochaetota bacterium]HOK92319.1 bifunctional pyr operon transcriptional regulator/uracil phosphoribosyltransferase PyrR [Spirochaetota bacterium]HON17039.1 bifunctional pyr operon transcriptional regul